MKRFSKVIGYGISVAAVMLAAGCLHMLESSEVNRLTTCQNTDLKKIKKNLLLAGYEVNKEDGDNLTTDFKQVSGYGGDKTMRRITVIKLDDKTYKFNVRLKSKRIESNQNNYSSDPYNKKKSDTTININMNQPIETENDFDQDYYKERVAQYESMRQEVCGN